MSSKDVKINISTMGQKTILTAQEQSLISDAVLFYADNLTPLNRTAVIELGKTIIESNKGGDGAVDTLSRGWIDGFFKSNDNLKAIATQSIEEARTDAVTPHHICEHVCRVKYAMDRYNITSPQ